MGKGDRKRKQAPPGCDLAPVPKKQKPFRMKWDDIDHFEFDRDPQKVALSARCNQLGMDPTEEARSAARSPWLEHPLGLVIQDVASADDRPKLWQAFCDYCRVYATYHRVVIGKSPHPKGATITMAPERIKADASEPVDTRTDEERHRDAVNNMAALGAVLMCLSNAQVSALTLARLGKGPDMWRDREPTPFGMVALKALEALCEEMG